MMKSFISGSPFSFYHLLNSHCVLGDCLLGTWNVTMSQTKVSICGKFTRLLHGGCSDSLNNFLPPVIVFGKKN